MECTPKYSVMYRGEIYRAGIPFKIDPKDANELQQHGEISREQEQSAEETVKRRPGRPKKTVQ